MNRRGSAMSRGVVLGSTAVVLLVLAACSGSDGEDGTSSAGGSASGAAAGSGPSPVETNLDKLEIPDDQGGRLAMVTRIVSEMQQGSDLLASLRPVIEVSVADEWAIGRQIAEERLQADIGRGRRLRDVIDRSSPIYLQLKGMLDRFAGQAEITADRPYTLHLVRTDQIMAYSMPGGHVWLSTGFLEAAPGDAASRGNIMRGVIGHEIAHVELGHHRATLGASLLIMELSDGVPNVAELGGTIYRLMDRGWSQEDEFACDAWSYRTQRRELNATAPQAIQFMDILDVIEGGVDRAREQAKTNPDMVMIDPTLDPAHQEPPASASGGNAAAGNPAAVALREALERLRSTHPTAAERRARLEQIEQDGGFG